MNKKYLPDVELPENVVAIPDIAEAVQGATALVFVMPHQCGSSPPIELSAPGLHADSGISLGQDSGWTRREDQEGNQSDLPHQSELVFNSHADRCDQGVDVKGSDIHIFADVIEERLGVSCSALSGANIAAEVATDRFSETTIGYRKKEDGEMWKKLFSG